MNVKPQLSGELRLIPVSAKIIAGLVPVCAVIVAIVIFLAASGTPEPADAQFGPLTAVAFIFLPLVAGGLLAIWVLLVGYVYADAKRRGMRRLLWMLVVIFVPNALGFILYFLLRHPVPAQCPGCGHSVDADAAYCPKCGRQVGQSCPDCSRSVGLTDSFCSGCGHALGESPTQSG